MKLHLLIDTEIVPKVETTDIAIVSRYSNLKGIKCRLYVLDERILDESFVIKEAMDKIYLDFDSVYKKTYNNAYVRYFRPIFVVIANIDKILKENNVTDIVLYEGSTSPYVIGEKGEGEGKRLHYRTNWLVNPYIEKLYCLNYKITWINKKLNVITSIDNLLWITIYWVRELSARIIKRVVLKKYNPPNTIKADIISVISLKLQRVNLESIYKSIKGKKHIYLSFNPTYVNDMDVYGINELSIIDLFRVMLKIIKLRKPKHISIFGVESNAIARSLQYSLMKYSIYEERLFRSFSFL